MKQKILITGFLLGALSVAIGAFGAHGLNSILLENGRLDVFETAVKYQFYHTFAIIILGLLYKEAYQKIKIPFYLFLFGIIIFSGSLYILSITNITFFGAITPFGGLSLIIGWIYSAIFVWRNINKIQNV